MRDELLQGSPNARTPNSFFSAIILVGFRPYSFLRGFISWPFRSGRKALVIMRSYRNIHCVVSAYALPPHPPAPPEMAEKVVKTLCYLIGVSLFLLWRSPLPPKSPGTILFLNIYCSAPGRIAQNIDISHPKGQAYTNLRDSIPFHRRCLPSTTHRQAGGPFRALRGIIFLPIVSSAPYPPRKGPSVIRSLLLVCLLVDICC